MRQLHRKKYFLGIAIILVVILLVLVFVKDEGETFSFLEKTLTEPHIYTDEAGRFTFNYPEGYTVGTLDEAEGNGNVYRTVLIQNLEKKKGIQIVISPFDEAGSVLTKQRIQKDIPGLVIKNEQPIYIGESGEGIAFMSDNAAFNGDSREVWFVYRGFFYQISTYMELDSVLQKLLSTWTFNK